MRITGITYVPRKTHKIRNTFFIFLLLILIVSAAISIISGYIGWNLLHPEKIGLEPFSSNIIPEYRDVSFNSGDGNTTLSGWFFENRSSDRAVILVHSYAMNRLQFDTQTLDMIKSFISEGYNVLSFDLRNSGKSGGKETSMGRYEKDDVLGAVNYIKSQGPKRIVLMGFSTGASASIIAAAESTDVEAVIADSPYAGLKAFLKENLSYWSKLPEIPFNRTILYAMELIGNFDADNVMPVKSAAAISPRSIFLIHGKNDGVIPVNNSKMIYKACSELEYKVLEYWEIEDAGHLEGYKKYPEDYMSRVSGFLKKVFD